MGSLLSSGRRSSSTAPCPTDELSPSVLDRQRSSSTTRRVDPDVHERDDAKHEVAACNIPSAEASKGYASNPSRRMADLAQVKPVLDVLESSFSTTHKLEPKVRERDDTNHEVAASNIPSADPDEGYASNPNSRPTTDLVLDEDLDTDNQFRLLQGIKELSNVEFSFVVQEDQVRILLPHDSPRCVDLEAIKQQAVAILELPPEKVRVTKLLKKLEMEWTAVPNQEVFPGDKVCGNGIESQLGLFVTVEADGGVEYYAMLTGHERKDGDKLVMTISNGKVAELGQVRRIILEGHRYGTPDRVFCDVALAKIDETLSSMVLLNQIQDGYRTLYLDRRPLPVKDIKPHMQVQKFRRNATHERGKIAVMYTNHKLCAEFVHNNRCLIVVDARGETCQFHGRGESGALLTTVEPDCLGHNQLTVGVAMLVGLLTIKLDATETFYYSVIQSLDLAMQRCRQFPEFSSLVMAPGQLFHWDTTTKFSVTKAAVIKLLSSKEAYVKTTRNTFVFLASVCWHWWNGLHGEFVQTLLRRVMTSGRPVYRRIRRYQYLRVTDSRIKSLAVLDNKLFYISEGSATIRVHSIHHPFDRHQDMEGNYGLINPVDMAARDSWSPYLHVADRGADCVWCVPTTAFADKFKLLDGRNNIVSLSISSMYLLVIASSKSSEQLPSLFKYSESGQLLDEIPLIINASPQQAFLTTADSPSAIIRCARKSVSGRGRPSNGIVKKLLLYPLNPIGLNVDYINTTQSDQRLCPDHFQIDESNHVIFVSDTVNNRVVLLRDDLHVSFVLLDSDHGLTGPTCLCFVPGTTQLVVGMRTGDIRIYSL